MPQPTVSDVHINRPLTNMSSAIIEDESNFVADQVFPNIPVQKRSDVYYTYDEAYWARDEMQERAPSTESVGSGYEIDNDTYLCRVYAIHKDISDQLRANADAPLNPDQEATRWVTRKALIKREKMFASTFLTTGVWTGDQAGVTTAPSTDQFLRWDDADSTPIEDVWDQKQAMLERTGFEPNTLVIGYPVLKALINHPAFVDRIKYGQTPNGPAIIGTSEIAALFKVERVLVMRATEVTSAEGAATDVRSFIGGKKALLVYTPAAPGIMTAAAGYTFTWQGYSGQAGFAGNTISRFRIEEKRTDRIEIEMAIDMKKIAAGLGVYFSAVVS